MTARYKLFNLLFLSAAVVMIPLLYFFVYPYYQVYFPKCMFYMLTGLHCPGCGSQRAFAALLQGDVVSALHDNILMLLLLPFLLYVLVIKGCNLFREKKIKTTVFHTILPAKLILIIIIVFTVFRNIPAYPFNLLAPLN